MRRFISLIVLFALGVVTVSIMLAWSSDEERITTSNEATPSNEKSFVQAVSDYGGSKFIYAKPLEVVSLRRQRAAAICATMPRGIVANWVGRVEAVGATKLGNAILRVYLCGGERVLLENWNEKTNADEGKFPIPEGSPAYIEVSKLEQNELVRFSGSFQPNRSDCFRTIDSETADETSNIAETMMSPTFVFQWADIRPLKN